jgi:hypothetical protein
MPSRIAASNLSAQSSHIDQANHFAAAKFCADVDNSKGTTRKEKITLSYWVNNTENYRAIDLFSSTKLPEARQDHKKALRQSCFPTWKALMRGLLGRSTSMTAELSIM